MPATPTERKWQPARCVAMAPRRSPTVGCGVFAVRAKISPPVATMRRRVLCSVAARRVVYEGFARFYDTRRPTERK